MSLFDPHSALILAFALVLDAALGDPGWIWRRVPHPVVLMGRLIGWLDAALNRGEWERLKRLGGVAALALLIAVTGAVAAALHWALAQHPLGLAAEIMLVAILLAQRSLYDHVRRVHDAFSNGGLQAAREAVSMIVGRDPEALDEAGVCRAAIETTAENFSDGVVAPAVWYLVAGLPGIAVYKAVNTADSMIGHRTSRHAAFGWAAARLDDLLNLIPARLSGLLIVAAAFLIRADARGAWIAMRHDARHHRSPNAGWPEAAMAGALGVALAGPRRYAGGPVDDAWMNAGGRADARPEDISAALRLFVAACAVQALIISGIAVALVLT
jgi:adenosylcobinamide-phosphate synthase